VVEPVLGVFANNCEKWL